MQRLKISWISALIIIAVSAMMQPPRLNQNNFSWDVFGYYLYLPATIIHQDPGVENQQWLNAVVKKYEPSPTLYQINKHPETGRSIIQYTSGMAVLYTPFFAVAHTISLLSVQKADGFTLWYQIMVTAGMWLYFALAIFALAKLSLRYFSDAVVAFSLLIFFFGTNLIQIASEQILSPHIGLFALYAFLLIQTDNFYRNPNKKSGLLIGLICGLIILNRPTEIGCLAIPFLWGVVGTRFKPQWEFWKSHKTILVPSIIIAVLIGSIQLIYWLYTSGELVYMSYTNAGEGLDLLTPHIAEFLFSFRKGWLVYTPLALLVFAGTVILRKKQHPQFWPVAIVLILSLYFMSSWTTWWYAGGSYSSRTMVNVFPVLFIPFTAAIHRIIQWRLKWIALSAVVLLTGLNLFQFWQWQTGILDGTRMTAAYYFQSFLATERQPDWDRLLLIERSYTDLEELPLNRNYREVITEKLVFDSTFILVGTDTLLTKALELDSDNQFSPNWSKPFDQLTEKDHVWLEIKAEVFIPEGNTEEPPFLTVMTMHKGKPYKYRAFAPEIVKSGEAQGWQTYTFNYLSPEMRSNTDELSLNFWYRSSEKAYVRSIEVAVLEEEL